jgi:hypothetical protein
MAITEVAVEKLFFREKQVTRNVCRLLENRLLSILTRCLFGVAPANEFFNSHGDYHQQS